MKKLVIFFASVLIFFLLRHSVTALSPPSFSPSSERVIIKFRSLVQERTQNAFLKSYHLLGKEQLRLPHTVVVHVPFGKAQSFISQFSASSLVEYAEQDFLAEKVEVPNDPYYSRQWGLEKIKAASAWNTTHGSASTTVAILDTGIEGSHPDVGGKIGGRANFTTDLDGDGDGHGTHVAGIVAAVTNNEVGIAGAGYDTRLLSVKVLDNSGSGFYSWIVNGIMWAADNGADVINLSLGGSSSSVSLKNAIDYAWSKGVVVVAAAGNGSTSRRFYPAYYAPVIATAAVDENDRKASFSNYGSWVDVAAPGVAIVSTYKGDYASFSGTSMATPFVSAVAALVFAHHPDWSNLEVRNKVEATADGIVGTGRYWTYGRINACVAVDCPDAFSTAPPTPTPTPTPTLEPTPLPTLTPTPPPVGGPTPTPTPATKPWWCRYIPTHPFCK